VPILVPTLVPPLVLVPIVLVAGITREPTQQHDEAEEGARAERHLVQLDLELELGLPVGEPGFGGFRAATASVNLTRLECATTAL
jgi:hypothetical protein